jgi:hypothetical protein
LTRPGIGYIIFIVEQITQVIQVNSINFATKAVAAMIRLGGKEATIKENGFVVIKNSNYGFDVMPDGHCEILTNYTKDSAYVPLRNGFCGSSQDCVTEAIKRIEYHASKSC